jgi:branched-subunit amino acid transport protein AzlD
MPFISLLLIVKIAVTGILVALPFMLLPADKLAKMTGAENATALFRLYGIAITALLVGYGTGFFTIARGEFPFGIAAMGIVSNGGAATYMFASGAWQRQRFLSVFLASIGIALVYASLNSAAALRPIW